MRSGTHCAVREGEGRSGSLWLALCLGLLAATLIPVGIHTVLLDNLGVPYPSAFPHEGAAILPDQILLMIGIVALDGVFRRLDVSLAGRLTFLLFTITAINQALLRLPIMRNMVSTKWTIYPFIDNVPEVARLGALVVGAMIINLTLRRSRLKIIAAIVTTAIVDLWFSPLLQRAFAGIRASNARREGDQLYTVPYDWHVDVPSYLTFIEPAAGALAVAIALRRAGLPRSISLAVLFAIQGGPLFRLLLNPFYASSSMVVAVLSEAQFTLQALALASIALATSCGLQACIGHLDSRGPELNE